MYDSYGGQLTTLKTLYGSTSQTANTTWIYDSYRGWLSEKKDHNSDGAAYEYTAAGRLSKRTWDRGDYVNYSYSNAGERRLANYTDVTPGVTTPDIEYSYNRTGTLAWAKDGTSDGSTITTQRYAHNSYYLTEHPSILNYTLISGVHTEDKYLRQRYDTGVVNRPAGYQLGTLLNADSDMETTYAYVANDGRLSQVTTESFETHVDTFTYSYGSAGQYGPTLLSGPQIYSAKSYLSGAPYFDIIDNKTSSGGSTVAKADYRYDTLGRRDRKDFSGSAYGSATYDTYGYNVNFEVTQGKRFTSGGAAVSGKEYNFTYDDIGNRLTSRDKYTTSAYDTAYTPNARNQYSGITGYHAASPVTYDTDGNLSALGTKTFLYNGENQLIEVKVGGSSVASFKYDFLGRRVEKSTPSKTETYAYDGWNLIALYDTGTGDKRPLITYSWGLDLSDTMQGAGGVGGLLMSCERDGTAWTYFEDGHGNVTQVISQSAGSVNAHMEYDPYGNLATTAPAWDRRNAFRFSSKFYDDETGLYYYGYRYYDGVHGRWLNRDPIGESGGLNLYGLVGNDPVDRGDYLGLAPDFIMDARLGIGPGGRPSGHLGRPPGPRIPISPNREILEVHSYKFNMDYLSVSFCGCDPNEIDRLASSALTRFQHFSFEGVSLEVRGNQGRFNPGGFGGKINDFLGWAVGLGPTHNVGLLGPGNGFAQRAITQPLHGLLGIRLWGQDVTANENNCDNPHVLNLYTSAWETWNNVGGAIRGERIINRTAQVMWPDYLMDTAKGVLEGSGCHVCSFSASSSYENGIIVKGRNPHLAVAPFPR